MFCKIHIQVVSVWPDAFNVTFTGHIITAVSPMGYTYQPGLGRLPVCLFRWQLKIHSILDVRTSMFGISTSHNYPFRPLFRPFTTGLMILVKSTRPASHLCCHRISQMTLCSTKLSLSFNWGRLPSCFNNLMYFVLPKKSLFFIERNFNGFHIFWVNFIFFTGIS
jgi:hypothetical protein